MKILLVEDDQKIGQLIATGLEQKAHQVVWVQDGHKAWKLLNGVPVDVLITDWKLPDLSATELVQKLRRDERLGQLPVLMMSGSADKSEIVAAIKAGINGLVVKPFTVAQLLEKINVVLQGSEHWILLGVPQSQRVQRHEQIHQTQGDERHFVVRTTRERRRGSSQLRNHQTPLRRYPNLLGRAVLGPRPLASRARISNR